jgi:hypothetical protein
MILKFFSVAAFLYVSNEVVRRKYPVHYSAFAINCMFGGIYSFSKLQMFYWKLQHYNRCLYKKLHPWLFEDNDSCKYEFVLNNKVVQTASTIDDIQIDKFDFILCSEPSKTNEDVVNFKILDSVPTNKPCFEESNVKFIMAELSVGDQKLEFKTNKYNYYITDNVFDSKFIRYFLRKHYKIDSDNYEIYIIDHNVNQVTLCASDCIHLRSDGYDKKLGKY